MACIRCGNELPAELCEPCAMEVGASEERAATEREIAGYFRDMAESERIESRNALTEGVYSLSEICTEKMLAYSALARIIERGEYRK